MQAWIQLILLMKSVLRLRRNKILVNQKDIIGYEWKDYDFDNAMYQVDPDKIYILKNRIGFYYKLRFIDYYNSTGEKGYPTFEFLRFDNRIIVVTVKLVIG